jgi:hypothetical protein
LFERSKESSVRSPEINNRTYQIFV